jgi:hypothetical protein
MTSTTRKGKQNKKKTAEDEKMTIQSSSRTFVKESSTGLGDASVEITTMITAHTMLTYIYTLQICEVSKLARDILADMGI